MWTDSLYEIHGVAKDDFDGTLAAFTPLIHPDDKKRVATAIARAVDDVEDLRDRGVGVAKQRQRTSDASTVGKCLELIDRRLPIAAHEHAPRRIDRLGRTCRGRLIGAVLLCVALRRDGLQIAQGAADDVVGERTSQLIDHATPLFAVTAADRLVRGVDRPAGAAQQVDVRGDEVG